MNGYKFFILASILLVSLLCISAVSAADDAASDIVADTSDETVLEESIDDAVLADSQDEENVLTDDPVQSKNFTELKSLIDSGDDEIELQCDYIYNEQDNLKNGIVINHNLTINGNGHKLDGNEQTRIFRVTDNAVVTFNNIYFSNGQTPGPSDYGGAIWVQGATAKAINCHFHYNYATYRGGAVAGAYCENCSFTKNQAFDNASSIFKGTAINCVFLT